MLVGALHSVNHLDTRAAFRVCLRVNSEVTLQRLFAQFALRVCLGGISNFTQEAKGSSKMANQNCSFDYKWQPPMEGTIFEAELCSE